MGRFKHILIAAQNVHQAQGAAVAAGVNEVGEAHVSAGFSLGAEVHQNLILNAPSRIGGKPGSFAAVKGRDCLDEADGADGDEIVLICGRGVVFFQNVGHQPKVSLHQNVSGLQIALGAEGQIVLLLLGSEGLGEGACGSGEPQGIEQRVGGQKQSYHNVTSVYPMCPLPVLCTENRFLFAGKSCIMIVGDASEL